MEVRVGIETQGPPTRGRLDILRSAAARFTDNQASIRVTHEPMRDRHCLVTEFTIRTTAQYKVVDEIAAGFKGAIWDFADYMDMWITFPKPKTTPRRRSRKPPSEAAGGLSHHTARLWVAASHTPGPTNSAPRACWCGHGKPRILRGVAVAGEPIGAGGYPMPNKGVQLTAYSLR